MKAESTATSSAEIVDEVFKWTVGGGLIVLVLFPLAVPILVLTAVALVPLLAPILALGLLVGVVALPVLLARRMWTGVPGAASGHRRSRPFARRRWRRLRLLVKAPRARPGTRAARRSMRFDR